METGDAMNTLVITEIPTALSIEGVRQLVIDGFSAGEIAYIGGISECRARDLMDDVSRESPALRTGCAQVQQ